MVAIIVFVFIIYAFVMSNKLKELQEENEHLKKQLKKLKSNNNVPKVNVISKLDINEKKIENKNVEKELEVKIESKKEIKDRNIITENKINQNEKYDKEIKNTSILIVGATLIILSAIVFLMSTWNVIPNFLKTITMLLFVGVFLGASKIAEKNFKLEKTSITFFYIAMAYIPICLISCSLFGLFGEFLSIGGEGKYIYLSSAIFITSIIYYLYYKRKNNEIMLIGTVLAQIFTLILFTLIFGESIIKILISLLIYNIIIFFISKEKQEFQILSYFYETIPYIIGIISLFYLFTSNTYMIIVLPLLAINLFVTKSDYSEDINIFLSNVIIYLLGIYIPFILKTNMSENIKVIFSILYLITVSLLNYIFNENEKMTKSSRIVSLVCGSFIYMHCLISREKIFFQPYVILLIELLLFVLYFFRAQETEKKIYSYLVPIVFIISGIDILNILKVRYYCYVIFAGLTFILGELLIDKKIILLNKSFFMISHIFIILSYLYGLCINIEEILNNVFIYLLIGAIYVYSFIRNKQNIIFKYLLYIDIGLLLNSINYFLELSELTYIIPTILSILILVFETNYECLRDNYSNIFNTVIQVFAYIALLELNHMLKILIVFLYSIYLIFDNIKNNKSEYLKIIPMLGLILVLNFAIPFAYKNYSILIILLSTILLTASSIYKGKFSIDTIFSGIYLINFLTYIDNELIQRGFLTMWALISTYFMKDLKSKDILKCISYISIFLLYNSLITNLILDKYSSFTMIGVTITMIALIKSIFQKYFKNLDTLEYIAFILIYLTALISYENEKDGMIFGVFLVGLLMYSYLKKYGALFIVTLVAIIVNAILLTREFWLLIPWWIYLLIIGFALIAFAIKNESEENNKRFSKNVIKNLKDKIEK